VGLTLEGLRAAAAARGLDWSSASVAVVGANGNIGQALARVLAPEVGRLLLVGSSREDSLARLELTRTLCVQTALAPDAEGDGDAPGPGAIRTELDRLVSEAGLEGDVAPSRQQVARLAQGLGRRYIDVAAGFRRLAEVDMVVIATNSADAALIRPDMVRRDAIVSCTSVPSNLDPGFGDATGILAYSGGLAQLPEGSEIRFVGLPEDGMTYGCLAETLLLGFDGCNHSFAKGALEPALVHKILGWAGTHGFRLGPLTFNGRVVVDAGAA
jgi:predicted amino acid dehydrogenase